MTRAQPHRAKIRFVAKRILFALIPTFAFWLVLELVLAFAGIQPVEQLTDPVVGFEGLQSLFVERSTADGDIWETRENKLVWFNDQQFAQRKPAGVRRVFCLGGSTTYGRPYDDTTSFSGWLREILNRASPNTKWEVINAGGISYASYRVASVMEEILEYEPDLVVVYSANNEFLERRTYSSITRMPRWLRVAQGQAARTRAYAAVSRFRRWASGGRGRGRHKSRQREMLPGEVSERLNKTVGPVDYARSDTMSQAVQQDYQLNLERMTQMARQKSVPLIFVSPAVNLRAMSPFKSQFSTADNAVQLEVSRQLGLLSEKLVAGDWQAAVDVGTQAVDLDDRYAESHYLLGHALFAGGEYTAAEQHFRRAVDEDVCPLRATSIIVDTLKTVAEEQNVSLVEFEAILNSESAAAHGHQSLGEEYFLDHVHPTIRANGLLGKQLAIQMAAMDHWQLDAEKIDGAIEDATAAIESRVDRRANGIALRNLAKVLHWAGKYDEAIRSADDAIELLGPDPVSRLILGDSSHRTGQDESAGNHFEILLTDSPRFSMAYLPYATFLIDSSEAGGQGGLALAENLLLMRGVEQPMSAHVLFQLARLYRLSGDFEGARQSLAMAGEYVEDDPVLATKIDELSSQLDRESPLETSLP